MTVDMGRQALSFAPLLKEPFSCFWSLDSGFGTVEFQKNQVLLKVLYGSLSLRHLSLAKDGRWVRTVKREDEFLPYSTDDETISFLSPQVICAGQTLAVEYLEK